MSDRYAYLKHPVISAIVHEMYRFNSVQEAAEQLAQVAKQFVIPKKQPAQTEPSLTLWIRGYGLTGGDAKQGVVGHFASIGIKEIDGRFALFAAKLDVPARQHPQRAQVRRASPNWGHPVLRAVRKEKTFASRDEALAALAQLHQDFPTVSTPTPDAVHILIYCADRPANMRMVKFKLSVKFNEDAGNFTLVCKERARKPRLVLPHQKVAAVSRGKFTAKVAQLRRKKKS